MFQPWRLKLREAEEALSAGRLEEASRLLRQQGLGEFLPAKRLMARLAREMTNRARKRFAVGETMAGWHDLETAAGLDGENGDIETLRREFVERGLAEAESYLAAGDPAAAAARLAKLDEQGAAGREVRVLHEVVGKVLAAQRHCQQGQFALAEQELQAASALRPHVHALVEIRQACGNRARQTRSLVEQLHAALSAEDWTAALAAAEAILELCPEHTPALDARRRAWAVVGTKLPGDKAPGSAPARPQRRPAGDGVVEAAPHRGPLPPAVAEPSGPRFLLWVDGVGGYLVCQGPEVTLGQPVQGSYVDVPILGDISRLHATIRRDGEGYLIHPWRPVRIDGRSIDHMTSLSDGNVIELGQGVRLKFRRPHPLSTTARLDFVSHHRTLPSTDGVILLAESCILGKSGKSHVTCPNWSGEVVLFPHGEQLQCRGAGSFEIDGRRVEGRGTLTRSSQVVGDDFSLSLEPL